MKKKICGIIVEWNPLHNGHVYHINESLRKTGADGIVAVMSGNFVQRGEPAIVDKYERVRAALALGVDVVLELPVAYATSSAKIFAQAAVRLLGDSGVVDSFCFGSEAGDIAALERVARILEDEPDEFKKGLRRGLDKGMSFAKSRADALAAMSTDFGDIIGKPNNILAIEYLIARNKYAPYMQAATIGRKLVEHHSVEFVNNFASATAIRRGIGANGLQSMALYMPPASLTAVAEQDKACGLNHINNFSHILHYIMEITPKKTLTQMAEITEGLENRIHAAAAEHFLISDIITACATKRYTNTTISRAILHILLGITKREARGSGQYLRVLGFRKQSADIVKAMARQASIPIVTNLQSSSRLPDTARIRLERDMQLSRMYWQGLRSAGGCTKDELTAPIIV